MGFPLYLWVWFKYNQVNMLNKQSTRTNAYVIICLIPMNNYDYMSFVSLISQVDQIIMVYVDKY